MSKKIILCGYMASGKTTISRLLSHATEIPYADLDHVIEKEAGKSISDIFKDEKEVAFRKREHIALKKLLETKGDLIISLGGGTPCYANNHLFLQEPNVISIYLKAGIKEIVARLKGQLSHRPLLAALTPEELEEYIAKHLFDRSYFYHQSKHTVVTDGKSEEQVVNAIISLL
ncbi:shikimate kinase [Flavobacterium rhizosphaerae]|uniref:Shikimate kinase n=1 Tax=Flavobacterium rhizosphaerae TaxID=3163298 RepID=A0ABW8Z050_9FLAO